MKKFMVNMAVETFVNVEVEADTKEEALRKAREGKYIDWDFEECLKFRDFFFPTNKALVSCLDDEDDEFETISMTN